MVDFSKLDPAHLDLPKLGRALAERGEDIAQDLAKRVKQESRSFLQHERAFERDARSWLASPAAQVAGAAVLGFVVGVAASGARKAAAQGAEVFAGDWLGVLKAEHRRVEGLFDALLKTTPRQKGRRAALFAQIDDALTKHALMEETVVYPALKETHTDGMAKHLYADHADIKILLHDLTEIDKADPAWLEKVRALEACVAHHVHEEEEDVYPRFHDQLSPQQNAKLTLQVHRQGLKLA